MRHPSILALLFVLTSVAAVPAQIPNPGFESGSVAWTATGGTIYSIRTTPSAFFPTEGDKYLEITAGSSDGAVAGWGPHPISGSPGSVAQFRRAFTAPAGVAHLHISFDWEFISREPAFGVLTNDFLSVDLLDQNEALVANLLFIDNGTSLGTTPYTNVPGGSSGLAIVGDQTGSTGAIWNQAPAGAKRAYSDLSNLLTAGASYTLAISVGNGGDDQSDSMAFIDNIRLQVARPNVGPAGLRVLGSGHYDGLLGMADTGGQLRPEGIYDFPVTPGQRLAWRATSTNPGLPWILVGGSVEDAGLDIPGFGVVNLDLSEALYVLIDGFNVLDPAQVAIGTLGDQNGAGLSLIDAAIPESTPLGTSTAYQSVMADPGSPTGLRLTAATDVIVDVPHMPLGDTLVVPDTPGGAISTISLLPSVGWWDFYGIAYSEAHINQHGNLTFGSGDTSPFGTEIDMVSGSPRIAPLWTQLIPGGPGKIKVKEESGTLTVSWQQLASTAGGVHGNSVALQIYGNGIFTMYFGGTTGTGGLVGIAPGGQTVNPGSPTPTETDLSSGVGAFGGRRTIAPGTALFERFALTVDSYGGIELDDFNDIMTLGISGPSSITFVPDGPNGYTCFVGTR